MSEDYNSINIDENYELLPNINNRKKKLLKKILLLLIVVAVIILLIISIYLLIGKKSYNKNLVFLVQDVSNSLQNFYNTDNLNGIYGEYYYDNNSILKYKYGNNDKNLNYEEAKYNIMEEYQDNNKMNKLKISENNEI